MEDVKVAVEEVEPSTAVYNVVRGSFVRPDVERRGVDGSGGLQLLVNCGDYIQLWEPVDGTLELQQIFYLFERIDHMDLVPASLGIFGPESADTVLLFTFDGRCSLFKLQPQAQRDQHPTGTSAPSTAGPYVLAEVACLEMPVPALHDGLMPKRLEGVCSSGVTPVSKYLAMRSSARAVVVAAIHMGLLHVLTLHSTAAGVGHGGSGGVKGTSSSAAGSSGSGGGGDEPLMMCIAVPIQETPLYGMPPGVDNVEVMAYTSHVYDMCFMPPPERDAYEPPLLVVLHKLERSGGMSFTVDSLALELQFGGRGGGGGGGETAEAAAGGSSNGSSSRQGSRHGPGVSSGSGAGGEKTAAAASPAARASGAAASSSGVPQGAGAAGESAAPLHARLLTGPWVARFLHPTTTVITPFPGVHSAGLPAGVLAISSVGVTLFCRPPTLGTLALAAATAEAAKRRAAEADPGPPLGDLSGLDPFDDAAVAALFERWFGRDFLEDAAIEFAEANVRHVELVQYALAGMPLCAEALAPGVFLIGDSAAGLTLLHAAGSQVWAARVLPTLASPPPFSALAMPKVLGYVPRATGAGGSGGGGGSPASVPQEGGSGQELDGLLFMGSDCSNSQVLQVPAAHLAVSAEPPPPPPTTVAKDAKSTEAAAAMAKEDEFDEPLPPPLPVLHWPVSELAAIKSLAPLTDVMVVPDSSGADDPWLVASCGRNAAGRLVRARLAAGLQPYMSDGPRVPDGCRMFPVRLEVFSWGGDERRDSSGVGPGPGHTHIAFSFEAANRTDLLSVAGHGHGPGAGHGAVASGEFTQVELPGLNHGSASLLVADVAGQRLVQVTSVAVRVLEPLYAGGALAVEWRAPEPLSLAAHSGSILAASSCTHLHLLRVDPGTGSVTALSNIKQLEAQLSALGLHSLPPPPPPPASPQGARRPGSSQKPETPFHENEATFILMGQWLSNRIEVAVAADPSRPLLQLQLGEDETPRSMTLMELSPGGAGAAAAASIRPPVLLIGTNTGRLLMWQLTEWPAAARPWRLGPCYSVRVSQVAVELQPVAASGPAKSRGGGGGGSGSGGGGGYVYIHSHSGALIRPRPQTAVVAAAAAAAGPPSLEQLLEVVRVHGSEGLQALCHVSTATMPDSTCWVTREGQLFFGRLDPRVKLRWSTAFVGETIHSFAYHAPSHCLVALCESHPIAVNSLRVIEVNSLVQVMSMRLSYGHYHTTITAGPLPCTSGMKAAAVRGSAATAVRRRGSTVTARFAAADPVIPQKEFVVLGSYLSVDSSCDPEVSKHVRGAELQYGALSFLDVVARPATDGSNSTQYQLLLEGTTLIPSVPTSLAIARPSPYTTTDAAKGGGGAAASATTTAASGGGTKPLPVPAGAEAAEPESGSGGGDGDPLDMPYLLVGCQGRVILYRVHVDDGRREGERAVKRALQLVGQVDEMNLPVPKHMAEVEAALKELDVVIKKRVAVEAKEARAAAGVGSQAGGADATITDNRAEGGGGDGEDVGLAEDESDLPEVEMNWGERLEALDAEEAEENIKFKYGLGLLERPDSDDEEMLQNWVHEQGPQNIPTEAARAAVILRKRLQREDMLGAADGSGDNGWGSGGGSSSDSGDDDDLGPRRRRGVKPSIGQLLSDLQCDWSQQVTMVKVDEAETFAGACVASLACLHAGSGAGAAASAGAGAGSTSDSTSSAGFGSLVLASDFLGSVTVMRLVASSRGAALISCGPDRHPIYAQAADWLDPEHILVAVHPHGLAVLRRHPAAEEEAMRAAQQKAVADFESGLNRHRQQQDVAEVWEVPGSRVAPQPAGARPGGGGAGAATTTATANGGSVGGAGGAAGGGSGIGAAGGGAGRFSMDDLRLLKPPLGATPGFVMEAACRVRHLVTRMCRVRLGLRLQPHDDLQTQHYQSTSSAPTSSPASTTRSSKTADRALPGLGLGLKVRKHSYQNWDPNDLLLCFSASGYVAAVRLQQQGSPGTTLPQPPLAKLARLQHALAALDPADTALITGVDSDSYCHSYSWPLVVPRQTAAGAALAGLGSSAVADEVVRRRAAPPASAATGTFGAGGGTASTPGDDEDFISWETEAEALAADCVDGTMMRVLLAAAETQLRKDLEAEALVGFGAASGRVGSAGGGVRLAALLRRLAREATGAADLGSLVGMLQRSSVVGINY